MTTTPIESSIPKAIAGLLTTCRTALADETVGFSDGPPVQERQTQVCIAWTGELGGVAVASENEATGPAIRSGLEKYVITSQIKHEAGNGTVADVRAVVLRLLGKIRGQLASEKTLGVPGLRARYVGLEYAPLDETAPAVAVNFHVEVEAYER